MHAGLAAAEAATILAQTFPSESALPDVILAMFAPGGCAMPLYITPSFIVGGAMTIIGAVLRLRAFRELGLFFTVRVSLRQDHRLITTGPYALIRHPSYTGAAIVFLGNALALLHSRGSYLAQIPGGVRWSGPMRTVAWGLTGYWLVLMLVVVPFRVMKEEEMLHREVGEEWDAYTQKTPYRMLPYIR